MRASVAHTDKNIVIPYLQDRIIYLFATYTKLSFGIADSIAVPDKYDMRVIILDKLHYVVLFQVDNGESRVSDSSKLINRKCISNSLDTFLYRQTLNNHGGYYL